MAATTAPSSEQIPAASGQPVGAATAAADEEAEQASPEAAAASGDKQQPDESPITAAESVSEPHPESGSKSVAAGAESNSDNGIAKATSAVAATGAISQNRLSTLWFSSACVFWCWKKPDFVGLPRMFFRVYGAMNGF